MMQRILTSNPEPEIELRSIDTKPTNEGFFRVVEYYWSFDGSSMISAYELAVDYFVKKKMSLAFSSFESFRNVYYHNKRKEAKNLKRIR